MLSAVIITKNESAHIEACLQSVSWVDEIIVLDSGSEDDTVQLCRKYTHQVYQTDWPGFGVQKQRAVDKASGDWILSIDADEIVTDDLRQEIQQVLIDPQYQGYNIPRLSSYCGKPMRHGGWWPDYTPRLFRKDSGHFTDSPVHERIVVTGRVGKLSHPLLHDAFVDLEEVLRKINSYSSLGAQIQLQKGKNTSLTMAIFRAMWTFFRTYILKAGFLDGRHGLMLAISNAEGSYYKYAKLLELQSRKQVGQ